MDDLISRQTAIDVVHKVIYDFFDVVDDDDERPITDKDKLLLSVNKAISTRLKQLPSAQPERKKGKWINQPRLGYGETWTCSECGEKTVSSVMGKPRYEWCPMCGAYMEGEEHETGGR